MNEEHDLKVVARCTTDTEAELIINLLNENGIEAFIDSNLPHSVWPVVDDALVVVRDTDFEQAKQIIAEYQENETIDIDDENKDNHINEKGE
ncbi:MAG TPA: DUF2007 domain-containing protein [Candidatus Hydrogenedens sp.]|nr:DUF2007 domain-containing protein [Candidatus Hydrogenedens sp.]HOL20597.1 DUF2007 domain-containing protein [Candidatus Hydrogenedens sp.]